MLVFDTLPSTNTYIKENIGNLEDKSIVIADKQIAGKGRLGNSWLCDDENGMLAMSLLIKNPLQPHRLTVVAAVAVSRAIEKLTGQQAYIKWTNDIICENKKICGILCESAIKGDSLFYVICGIGINISQPQSFFDNNNLPNGASLKSLYGKSYAKIQLAELVVENIISAMNESFENILACYKEKCCTLGKYVKFIRNNKEVTAYAKDINSDGMLICEADGNEFTVSAGEVRVRSVSGDYI